MSAKRKREISSAAQSSAMQSSSAGERFDRNADLTLIVGDGDEKREFLICSRSLARANPVFQQMLFGSFRESRSSQNSSDPWVVTLPEDSATVAKLLFSIVHGRFNDIPKSPSLHELLDVLVFTDKYDMTQTIRPWVKDWVSSATSWQESLETRDYITLIGVAWELGNVRVLETLTRRLILESTLNGQGQLCYSKPGRWEPIEDAYMPLAPLDFLEMVQDARTKLLTEIFNRLREMIVNLQDLSRGGPRTAVYCCKNRHCHSHSTAASTATRSYCKNEDCDWHSTVACHALALGVIVSSAALKTIGPKVVWGSESTYSPSIRRLMRDISNIRKDLHEYLTDDHEDCNVIGEFAEELGELVGSQPNPLSEEHLARMEAQQEKLGLSYNEADPPDMHDRVIKRE